jgi:hypothetical protein
MAIRWGKVGYENEYGTIVTKHEGKRPLGTLKCGWVGNIKMDLTELGCESVRTGLG